MRPRRGDPLHSAETAGGGHRWWSCLALCSALSVGCGGDTERSRQELDGGGTNLGGSGGGNGAACATVELGIRAPRQFIELVVEASDSMNEPMLGSTLSRWDYLRDSLEQFINELNYTVRLGLIAFPADGQCSGVATEVLPSIITDAHRAALISALGNISPGGAEPLAEAYTAAQTRGELRPEQAKAEERASMGSPRRRREPRRLTAAGPFRHPAQTQPLSLRSL